MIMFFSLCAFMSALQINENINLLRQKSDQLATNKAFSAIEFIWFFVVLYFLFSDQIGFYGRITCMIFLSYNIFGWIVAMIIFINTGQADPSHAPSWYLKANVVWSSIFGLSSIYTLATLIN
jgi:hypothetical protein